MPARNVRRGREPFDDNPLSQKADDLLTFLAFNLDGHDTDAIIILREGDNGATALHIEGDDDDDRHTRAVNTLLNTADALARTYGLRLEFDFVPVGQG